MWKTYLISTSLLGALLGCQSAPPVPPVEGPRQIANLPADFCYLDEYVPEVKVEMMYAGSDNFVGRPIDGYIGATRAVLRRDAADALRAVAQEMQTKGYTILLKDAYRPHRALADIYRWSLTPDESMKQRYYPRISKAQIHSDKYIGKFSEHSLGIAVDITLLDSQTGQELDMGGPIDFLDPSSATRYDGNLISETAKKNRAMLRATMRKHGFYNYKKEWWHYWLGQPKQPTLRYDFTL